MKWCLEAGQTYRATFDDGKAEIVLEDSQDGVQRWTTFVHWKGQSARLISTLSIVKAQEWAEAALQAMHEDRLLDGHVL